ncbi:MAG: YncE family protein [Acidimicrobiales bacterium]
MRLQVCAVIIIVGGLMASHRQSGDSTVWAAVNQSGQGRLEPVSGAGSTLGVETGDLLNSFATSSGGPLGLATASDGEGDSQAFIVSPSTREVVSLGGEFVNLEGSAVLPNDEWGYLADQGLYAVPALDAVNLSTDQVTQITSLPGSSPAMSAVAACNDKKVVATDDGDNLLDIFSGVEASPTDPTERAVAVDPDPVAVACSRGFAYVVSEASGALTVIDLATASVTATIAVGTEPDAVAVAFRKIYVANSGSNNISIIAVGATKVKATVDVGSSPDGIAVSGDVYVSNYGSNNVTVLTPGGSPVETIGGVPAPEAVAVVKSS